MNNNLLNSSQDLEFFKTKGINYTLSSRTIESYETIQEFIDKYFYYIDISQVESLFGFEEEFSPLYGGRVYGNTDLLKEQHLSELDSNNIGFSLTLTNHYFSQESYKQTLPLLKKHHHKRNSIVCTNDELAQHIKRDFPLYKLKASLIKNINTLKKVEEAFELYDYVVIPMELNDDDRFLSSLPKKERIILFANATCAYNCTSRICFNAFSKTIQNIPHDQPFCSKDLKARENLGYVFFDLEKLYNLGFRNFKLVPDLNIIKQKHQTKMTKDFILDLIKKHKSLFYLFSFPKSGRTWLRYIIAHYFNKKYDLGIDLNMHTMFSLIPNDTMDNQTGLLCYRYVQDDRFPALVTSHLMQEISQFDARSLILVRNVYDVIVSDYFQHKYFLKVFSGTLAEFIRKEKGSLSKYCHFINSIKLNRSDLLLLSYEMMHQDIFRVMKKVLSFLGQPIDPYILQEAIELSSFNNMKKSEQQYGHPLQKNRSDNPNSFRVREGKVDGYKSYLNSDDIGYIDHYCKKNLTESSKNILLKLTYKGDS